VREILVYFLIYVAGSLYLWLLGVAVFYAIARALRVAELEMAWTAVAGPLARRLRMSRDKMN
jgi:hypothetical protein